MLVQPARKRLKNSIFSHLQMQMICYLMQKKNLANSFSKSITAAIWMSFWTTKRELFSQPINLQVWIWCLETKECWITERNKKNFPGTKGWMTLSESIVSGLGWVVLCHFEMKRSIRRRETQVRIGKCSIISRTWEHNLHLKVHWKSNFEEEALK